MKHDRDLEAIAGAVHSAQTLAYLLGLIYHVRKAHRIEALICGIAVPYHLLATIKHLKRVSASQSNDTSSLTNRYKYYTETHFI